MTTNADTKNRHAAQEASEAAPRLDPEALAENNAKYKELNARIAASQRESEVRMRVRAEFSAPGRRPARRR